jgi:hypothetical protein
MSRSNTHPGSLSVDALTLKVLVNTKSNTAHAPAHDGGSVCRSSQTGSIRRIDSVSPRATLCGACFTADIVERWPDQLDGIYAAVRGE